VLAGAFGGLAFAVRPYTAVVCAVPFLLYVLRHRPRGWHLAMARISLGGLPAAILVAAYNARITGSPLVQVSQWFDPVEGIGFVNEHTLMAGLLAMLKHVLEFLYWTPPFLLPLYVAVLLARPWRPDDRRYEDWIFVCLAVSYVFYWSAGGNQYGPRYYVEGFPFMVLTVCAALFGRNRLSDPSLRSAGVTVLVIGSLLHVAAALAIAREERAVVFERSDVFRIAREQRLKHAVVFLASGTGVRRPMAVQDLTRNGVDASADVLYVWDRGEQNQSLMTALSDRAFYRYFRNRRDAHGVLQPLTMRQVPQ